MDRITFEVPPKSEIGFEPYEPFNKFICFNDENSD